ncbi:MAG: hypothetical protein WDM89_00135 [Rhizomicrobium sp.]
MLGRKIAFAAGASRKIAKKIGAAMFDGAMDTPSARGGDKGAAAANTQGAPARS